MIVFFKMQAIGNDFVIIDCTRDYPKYNLNVFSKYICDRKYGIGADGVILFYNSKIADIKMRIFNSDGSEAEMCGNGIRCLAKLLYDKRILKKDIFNIETLGGIKRIKLYFENQSVSKIEVNIGRVFFNPNSIPVFVPKKNSKNDYQILDIDYNNRIFKFIPVSVGNPHAICFVNDFSDFNFEKVGEYVENYKYFPKKTNVEFVKIENNSRIKVKVWERGVGRTLGCGTGAIAATAVAIKKLYTKSEIIVELDGGNLEIKKENDEFLLKGEAEFVFEGRINL